MEEYVLLLEALKQIKKSVRKYESEHPELDTKRIKTTKKNIYQNQKIICPCCNKEMILNSYYVYHKHSKKYLEREKANGTPFKKPIPV